MYKIIIINDGKAILKSISRRQFLYTCALTVSGIAVAQAVLGQSTVYLPTILKTGSTPVPTAPPTSTPTFVPTASPTAQFTPTPGGGSIPTAHPRILLSDTATADRLTQQLANSAPSAVRFKQMVDLEITDGNVYAFEPWFAALIYRLTNTVSYATFAIQRTDAWVAAEETRIQNGQRAEVAGDSYLEVGPIIGNLALVYDWCWDRLTETQRSRWRNYANQAVWNVWHHEEAKWGTVSYPWSGWSVDNPANNYYYSFLQATMLLGLATNGENDQAETWLTTFRTTKLKNQLFPIFNRDLQGGGSREGTGYGTAMARLFRLYDWWERSTSERVATQTGHTLASIAHLMHNITPTLDKLAPTGDHARDSTAELFDYHRDYLQTLIALFPSEPISAVAKTLLAESSLPKMAQRFMFFSDFLYARPDVTARPLNELATAYYGAGTGQFMLRSSWAKDALFANFICGPYSESHAHRDQGSFVLFKGGWLATDQNLFSHSGIEQDEALHNLVRIEQNGSTITQVESAPPSQMLALAHTQHYSYAAARITPIYNGKTSVVKVEREFVFLPFGALVVFDRVVSQGSNIKRIWTLNLPLMPTINGDLISLTQDTHRLDVHRLAPTGLTSQVIAWPTVNSEMNAGVRVDTAHSTGNETLFLHVLGVDGAVSSAMRSDNSEQIGAQISFAGGESVTIRFASTASGGAIEVLAANGSTLVSGDLPTTVQVPPLFVGR